MNLFEILRLIVIVGIVVWAVNRFVPMGANFKEIFNWVAILGTLLWILNGIGLFNSLRNVNIGR